MLEGIFVEFLCSGVTCLFKKSFSSVRKRVKQNAKKGDAWKTKSLRELADEVERNVKSSIAFIDVGDFENAKRQATDATAYSAFLMKAIDEWKESENGKI